jgi:hypothetical protein
VSGRRAKLLRRLAEDETPPSLPDRDIVAGPQSRHTAVNSPRTVRGVYRALKKADKHIK